MFEDGFGIPNFDDSDPLEGSTEYQVSDSDEPRATGGD